jgi:hypothetical protein
MAADRPASGNPGGRVLTVWSAPPAGTLMLPQWRAARVHPGEDSDFQGRHPLAIVDKFFAAFGRHDVDAIIRLCTDDVVEDLTGVGPVEGTDNERAFLGELACC